jgi:hypothetical protein
MRIPAIAKMDCLHQHQQIASQTHPLSIPIIEFKRACNPRNGYFTVVRSFLPVVLHMYHQQDLSSNTDFIQLTLAA